MDLWTCCSFLWLDLKAKPKDLDKGSAIIQGTKRQEREHRSKGVLTRLTFRIATVLTRRNQWTFHSCLASSYHLNFLITLALQTLLKLLVSLVYRGAGCLTFLCFYSRTREKKSYWHWLLSAIFYITPLRKKTLSYFFFRIHLPIGEKIWLRGKEKSISAI